MTIWDALWIGWLLIFGALEGVALANTKSGDTFSERVWAWFAIDVDADEGSRKRGVWMWRARRFSLLALVAWLAVHFLSGGMF
jgi:hypothetical protein